MSITMTLTSKMEGVGTAVLQSVSKTGSGSTNIREEIADSETDLLVAFVADITQMKGLFILSDQALTIKTNSSGEPQETISLLAGVPLMWHDTLPNQADANPFSDDITALYVTNASGETANLTIAMLVDATIDV